MFHVNSMIFNFVNDNWQWKKRALKHKNGIIHRQFYACVILLYKN